MLDNKPFIQEEILRILTKVKPINGGSVTLPVRDRQIILGDESPFGLWLSIMFYPKTVNNKLVWDKFTFEGVEYDAKEFLDKYDNQLIGFNHDTTLMPE